MANLTKKSVCETAQQKLKEWKLLDKIPIEPDLIMEEKLNVEIIPSPGLKNRLSKYSEQEALLSNNGLYLLIDEEIFMHKHINRWRFTVAHEVGHIVLHSNVFNKITTFEEFEELYENHHSLDEWVWMEKQANWFASFLLIPTEILKKEYPSAIEKVEKALNKSLQANQTNDYLADLLKFPICETFGVSEDVARIRLLDYLKNKY